jgi:DNA repair exonuclease SbcCD nuclease subunit
MKLLLVGDPHIRHTHLIDGKKLLTWVESKATELKPDLVINLGDTFDTHSVVRAEVLSEVYRHVLGVSKIAPYAMILGNHDCWKPSDSTYHALEVFKSINNVVVADRPVVYEGISLVPFLPDPKKWPLAPNGGIALTHNTFIGADYGFKIADGGVPLEAAECFDLVVSGHIHKRQDLGNVHYVGTPMAISAAEVDQIKGLTLLETETLERTFIPSPFPCWRSASIAVGDPLPELNEKDYWILKVKGTKADIKSLSSSREFDDLLKRCSVSLRIEALDREKVQRTRITSGTVTEMVEKYVDVIYSGNIDKSELKTALRKSLEEAGIE